MRNYMRKRLSKVRLNSAYLNSNRDYNTYYPELEKKDWEEDLEGLLATKPTVLRNFINGRDFILFSQKIDGGLYALALSKD